MTGNDIMAAVRRSVADNDSLNYTDEFLLQNINAAIQYLSKILIKRKAPEMTAEKVVIDYTAKPSGFHSFVGQPPLWLDGDVIRSYYGRRPVPMRYFRHKPTLRKLSDEISFSEDYSDAIITAASMLCLNKDEFNTEFEASLISAIESCLAGEAAANASGN